MHSQPAVAPQPLTAGMRRMLLVASGLVFIVGVQLFVLPTATAQFFAWTINPPYTAAFLGAAYWSSCVLELLAARETLWARARVAVPAVLLFTSLTLLATLLHLEPFHFELSEFAWYTVALTWVWVAVYAVVPPSMALLLVVQLRAPGSDPPRERPLVGWLRGLLALQAVAMLGVGLVLFVAPAVLFEVWPWQISALTGRSIGAWLLGLGLAAAHMAWEDDYSRLLAPLSSMVVFAVLQFAALARFPGDIRWEGPQTWVYILFLVSILVGGTVGGIHARMPAGS